MKSGIADEADFSRIRYAQCWEDADVLLEGLRIRPGAVCVSIASAGDNSLSLLAEDPARVVAVDLNPAQLACLELRVAAYRKLQHGELLELLGARPSTRRAEWYAACREGLSAPVRAFWDERPEDVAAGIGGATADAVGERLARLAKKRQILVVTHSPQVAAKSNYHAIVVKTGKTNPTTKVLPLSNSNERTEEIARMLSGAEITKEARAQAAKLLEKSAA